MIWWRQRPTPPPLDYSWTDRVDSVEANLGFTANIHLTVHTGTGQPGGRSNDGGDPGGEPGALSRAAIWTRARVEEVTRQWDVLQRSAAQHDVNARLSEHLPHMLPGATLTSVTAVLSVPVDDTRAAHELLQARREARLDELARRQTGATLRFLREECFDNPASARLFLMLNTTTRLGVFPTAQQAEDIVAEVTRWHPDTLWVQLARTLQTALGSLTSNQTNELLRVLSAALHSTGYPDQARTLQDLRVGAAHDSNSGPDKTPGQ